jgi:hypothetical protein
MDTSKIGIRITDRFGRFICRGKDSNGNWVVGTYFPEIESPQIWYKNENDETSFKEIDPKTLGQRITVSVYGEEDRFLFEGDVVDYGRVVSFVSRETSIEGESTGMDIGWYIQRDNFESWSLITIGEEFVVHGNIHDDPDLPRKIKDVIRENKGASLSNIGKLVLLNERRLQK